MSRTEQLYESYEDALFALLMDKVAKAEGARLLEENERLQNDPNAAVPEHIDKACMDTIRRTFEQQKRKRRAHSFGKLLRHVAVAVIIMLALFMAAYAAFPEVRARTLSVLVQSSGVASRLWLEQEGKDELPAAGKSQMLMGYSLPYLSSNYIVVDQGEDRLGAWIRYANDMGGELDICISKNGVRYFDTEAADIQAITIQDHEGELIEKDGTIKLYWVDTDQSCYIELTGYGIDREWLIDFAKGIVFSG